jgi:hypothetical protein
MFFPNLFMNSEEFKDLGNLHYERRQINYFPQTAEGGSDRKRNTESDFFLQTSAGAPALKRWKQK